MGDIRLDITAQGDTAQARKEVADLRQEVAATNAQNEASVGTSEAAAGAINAEGAAAEKTTTDLGGLAAAEREAAVGAEAQAAATQGATATMTAAEQRMAAFQAQLAQMGAQAGVAAEGEAAVAGATTAAGASFASAALPLSYFALALVALPGILKAVDEGSTSLGEKISELISGFDDEAVAARKSGESEADYAARVREVRQAHDDLLRARVAAAAGVIQETNDTRLLTTEYLAHASALRGAVDGGKDFLQGLKALGLEVPDLSKTLDTLRGTTQVFLDTYKATLEEKGPAAAKFFAEQNKARMTEVINDLIHLGQAVPPALAAYARELGIITEAEKNAAKDRTLLAKADEEIRKFNALRDAIANAGQKYGDERIAIGALQKDIDALIAKLEAQRLNTGKLTDAEQDQLNHLLIWRGQVAEFPGVLDKMNEAVRIAAERQVELANKLTATNKAYADGIAKIEERRKTEISAAESTTKTLITDLGIQVKQTEAAHDSRSISDTDYNTKINTLFAQQAIARQKEYDREREIDLDAQKDKEDLATKHREATKSIEDDLTHLNSSVQEATDLRTKLETKERERVTTLEDEKKAEALAREEVDNHSRSQKDFVKDLQISIDKLTGAGGANEALKTHREHHAALNSTESGVPATSRNVAELGTQFGVTAGEVPGLNAQVTSLRQNLQGLRDDAVAAAAAIASIPEGPPSGGAGDSTGLA